MAGESRADVRLQRLLAVEKAAWLKNDLEEGYLLRGHAPWQSGETTIYGPNGAAFSPDEQLLATASEDGTAKVWDAATGQGLITLTVLPQGRLDIAITPDGKYLATAGRDGAVRLFVLSTEELNSLGQSRVTRSLTEEECRRYLHLESCPQP